MRPLTKARSGQRSGRHRDSERPAAEIKAEIFQLFGQSSLAVRSTDHASPPASWVFVTTNKSAETRQSLESTATRTSTSSSTGAVRLTEAAPSSLGMRGSAFLSRWCFRAVGGWSSTDVLYFHYHGTFLWYKNIQLELLTIRTKINVKWVTLRGKVRREI